MIGLKNDIKRAYFIIPLHLRGKFKTSIFLTLLNGFLDLFSLGLLIPTMIAFLSPSEFDGHNWLSEFLPLVSTHSFQVYLLVSVLVLFVIKNAAGIFFNNYQNKSLFEIASALSEQAYHAFFDQSYIDYTQGNSAVVSRKINALPHDFAVYILASLINIFSELIIATIILIVLIAYAPFLILLLAATLLPILLVWKWFRNRHVKQIEAEFKKDYSENAMQLMKGIDSFIDVSIHQRQSYFIEKFMTRKRLMNSNYSFLRTVQQMPTRILEVVLIASIALLFTFSSFFDNQSIIPILTLFIAAFYRLYPSITKIISASTSWWSYRYVMDELANLQFKVPHAPDQEIEFNHQITLNKVDFAYEGTSLIIQRISLNIQKGECYAIKGKSGVGKSTLVKILMGFLAPTSGSVSIDGKNLSNTNSRFWLSKIGYLQQYPVIVDGSLLENVAFGDSHPDLNRAKEALIQANLNDFLQGLPLGLNTELGENGLRISGGQIQRIALARSLYKQSDLLIFDEVSNNLDKANLERIMDSIRDLIGRGKTILIIDHNPELLQLANKVWEVADGSVIESTVKS